MRILPLPKFLSAAWLWLRSRSRDGIGRTSDRLVICLSNVRAAGFAVSIIGVLAAYPASSTEISLSGFGTVGYTRSDREFVYDRFINDRGTLRRDSIIGLQADVQFGSGVGATVQLRASPSSTDDKRYRASVGWAFVSYRPTNDWLIRAGRQRMPLYLHSANFDVGATYDFARLPTEMYSISPNNEIDGLSVTKNWTHEIGETTLDAFWGKTNADVRLWARDNVPPLQNQGAFFRRLSVEGGGLVLSHRRYDDIYRLAYGSVMVRRRGGDPIPTTFPFVGTPFPGVGYYQVDNALPGPGIPNVNLIRITSIIVGADVDVSSGYRIVGEFAHTLVPQTDLSTQSVRGYASLLKRADRWTPYITYAFLRSHSRPLNLFEKINNSSVPAVVPGASLINASQRIGADQILAFDQRSLSIGTSYALSTTSKIKAELMHVRIGKVSSLVDTPSGGNIRNQSINVISLSYSVVF